LEERGRQEIISRQMEVCMDIIARQ
jgi:hypothetical protein